MTHSFCIKCVLVRPTFSPISRALLYSSLNSFDRLTSLVFEYIASTFVQEETKRWYSFPNNCLISINPKLRITAKLLFTSVLRKISIEVNRLVSIYFQNQLYTWKSCRKCVSYKWIKFTHMCVKNCSNCSAGNE